MSTQWDSLKAHLRNSLDIGGTAVRKSELQNRLQRIITPGTLTTYLNYFVQAGYLVKPRRGYYQKAREIPIFMTLPTVKEEAYGDRIAPTLNNEMIDKFRVPEKPVALPVLPDWRI